MHHHRVKLIAMGHKIFPAISGIEIRGALHLDAAEMRAQVRAQKLVVVAGDQINAGAAMGLGQQRLHHIVVRLRP